MLDILLRVNESYDRDELIELSKTYATYDCSHLTANQIKNVLSTKLGAGIEIHHA